MIVLDGLPALSPFRLERLNRELARIAPGCSVAAAWFVYFVAFGGAPPDDDGLRSVLRAGPGTPNRARLWVVPRLGTISPWSTKARSGAPPSGCSSSTIS